MTVQLFVFGRITEQIIHISTTKIHYLVQLLSVACKAWYSADWSSMVGYSLSYIPCKDKSI